MTLDQLLDRFAAEHFDRNSISEHRRAATLRTLRGVAAQVAPRTLLDLTPSDLMAWQGAQLQHGLKPTSLQTYETMIHAFVSWARLAGLMTFEAAAQLKSVPPPRGANAKRKPRPYKRSELQVLRVALDTAFPTLPERGAGSAKLRLFARGKATFRGDLRRHARRLQFEAQIALALEEGLRIGEIGALTLPRLWHENESVVVLTAKSKPGERREREVPYTDHARLCVKEWLEFRQIMDPPHDYPWLALLPKAPTRKQGRRLMIDSLEVNFDAHTTPVRIRWHRLRHTFATEYLRAGLPLEKLQLMMGHANLQQTLAYAEIVNADVTIEAERTAPQFARNLGLVA